MTRHNARLSGKQKRLAIIVGIAVAVAGAVALFDEVGDRAVDRDAHRLAVHVHERLRAVAASEVDDLVAETRMSEWEGRDSPFIVEGDEPEVTVEVSIGFVARYRVERLGATRCVDAVWPSDGRFYVDVNGCRRYERP